MPACPGCREEKPAAEFYANASRPNGLQARCKECDKRRGLERRSYQARYRATHKAQQHEWQRLPSSRARQGERERSYRKDPEFRRKKRVRENRRHATSVQARIADGLRSRLHHAVRGWI